MSVLTAILVALHLLGMAAIVGTFLVQMRAKSGYNTGLMLGGAITQFVTGGILIGLLHGNQGFDLTKYTTHGTIGILILVFAIVALVVQRKGGRVAPFFHTVGGLAVINLLIAVLWRQY